MSKVKEFFGLYTKRDDIDWGRIASEQYCPYIEKKCVKVRKSIADTSEYLNKHLVLVIQDCFRDYMVREFSFSHMQSARQGDSFHLHPYILEEIDGASLRLRLDKRISTDANGIALCLGLQSEAKVELGKMTEYLENRISDKTLFNIV